MTTGYQEFPLTESFKNSHPKLLANDKAALTCNAGTAFPDTANTYEGMLCYRTDEKKLYFYCQDAWREFVDADDADTAFPVGGANTVTWTIDLSSTTKEDAYKHVARLTTKDQKPYINLTYLLIVNGEGQSATDSNGYATIYDFGGTAYVTTTGTGSTGSSSAALSYSQLGFPATLDTKMRLININTTTGHDICLKFNHSEVNTYKTVKITVICFTKGIIITPYTTLETWKDSNSGIYSYGADVYGNLLGSKTINPFKPFRGADKWGAGDIGLVPAPALGQSSYFLRGDGRWSQLSTVIAKDCYHAYTTGTKTYDFLFCLSPTKLYSGVSAIFTLSLTSTSISGTYSCGTFFVTTQAVDSDSCGLASSSYINLIRLNSFELEDYGIALKTTVDSEGNFVLYATQSQSTCQIKATITPFQNCTILYGATNVGTPYATTYDYMVDVPAFYQRPEISNDIDTVINKIK